MLQQDATRQWYLHREGRQYGPLTNAEFQRLVDSRQLRPSDALWCSGLPSWVLVSEFEGIEPTAPAPAAPAPAPNAAGASPEPAAAAQPAPASAQPQRPASTAPQGTIFVSYRRSVDAWVARSVYEFLVREMGEQGLFMDIEGIDPGDNWRTRLRDSIAASALFVPIIGPLWLEAKARNGHHIAIRRPDDIVRFEIETALDINRRRPGFVVPLLVDTPMPDKDDLPGAIVGLADCQALTLTHADFRRVLLDLKSLCAQRAVEWDARNANVHVLAAEGWHR